MSRLHILLNSIDRSIHDISGKSYLNLHYDVGKHSMDPY
jgi:hypothetical protein